MRISANLLYGCECFHRHTTVHQNIAADIISYYWFHRSAMMWRDGAARSRVTRGTHRERPQGHRTTLATTDAVGEVAQGDLQCHTSEGHEMLLLVYLERPARPV
jgi:hypothetical protein